jgi:hypothetical protein
MNARENILERLRTVKPALQQEFPLRRMAVRLMGAKRADRNE